MVDSGPWAPPGFHWDPDTNSLVPDSPDFPIPGQPLPTTAPVPSDDTGTRTAPDQNKDRRQLPAATTMDVGGGGGDFVPPAERFSLSDWYKNEPIFSYDKFVEPTAEEAMSDPNYQFEMNEGERALQQAAAAKGVLNGGGTLKDIAAWAQNYATSRIADVRNRALSRYQVNYQAALDAFTGKMSGWQTFGQMGQRQNETDWMHAYTPWNDTWNRRVTVAGA